MHTGYNSADAGSTRECTVPRRTGLSQSSEHDVINTVCRGYPTEKVLNREFRRALVYSRHD